MPDSYVVYPPAERPLCEARVGDRWVPAEVRMWVRADDGSWTADVGYSPVQGENRIGTFRSDELRGLGHDQAGVADGPVAP